tara:strand:+ start:2800 stop:3333 length:534 start_codon:yes stop_codon:yes gene_type:complete
MDIKGLSNNPKIRKKVRQRAMSNLQYFGAKADAMTRSTVQTPNPKFNFERFYPQRQANIEQSYQTGKPVKSQTNPKVMNKSLSQNVSKDSYARSISKLNQFNEKVAGFGRKMQRLSGAFDKDKVLEKAKNMKTMSKAMMFAKNITVPGIVGSIMSPKELGDATLNKKKKDRNPNFPR